MTADQQVALELRRAVDRVRALASAISAPSTAASASADEAAALLAAILNAPVRSDAAPAQRWFSDARVTGAQTSDPAVLTWAEVTQLAAGEFNAAAALGGPWQSRPTPHLVALLAGQPGRAAPETNEPSQAQAYAQALADLAAAAARVEPIDLRRVNAAAFVAATQLRALAPEHGQLPPSSVVPISQGVGSPGASRSALPSLKSATGVSRAQSASADSAATPDVSATPPATETYAELLRQLDDLVGLEPVKADVRRQAEMLRVARIRTERGFKTPDITRHLVFTGSPGTGKTTVARLVAKIYRSLGLLDRGHLVELDRTGLVGGYLGQTETKTAEAVQRALGGVLFIDEAYALAGDQYGDAAVAVLVKAMEDHREDLVVIAAGYTDRMSEFLDMNPGLSSRLRLTIFFPNYSDDELVEIFARLARQSDYSPTADCVAAARGLVAAQPRDESFGNARFVRQCFEAAMVRHAWRLRDIETPTDEQLRTLTADDVAIPST